MVSAPDGGPSLADVQSYLTSAGLNPAKIGDAAIADALEAERQDQANRLRFPLGLYDDSLAEALCRRVARNLSVRPLPLGVQPTVTDAGAATAYIGSTDPEVRRLEAPYRKVTVG
ncbi:hypothetical protein GCM10009798_43440 [Nocardioides panacihumi]|uniref:Type II secretion system protein GspE N-terminal domain-containing protein n=1 Tax=Nocardioides panacihumi TaxID=400774 RepID=A0ABN2RZ33_9ACTN